MENTRNENLLHLWYDLLWYLWQLLPFEYHSVFLDNGDGHYYHTVWRMWFGRCFWIRENRIGLTANNADRAVVDGLYELFGLDGDVDLVQFIKARVTA